MSPQTSKPDLTKRKQSQSIFESPKKITSKKASVKEDAKKKDNGIDFKKVKTQRDTVIGTSKDTTALPS